MHNNFYFLNTLTSALDKALNGFTLVSCFSQSKDELIIEFNNGKTSFFIKAALLPEFQCLSFPEIFHRAKKNSIDLFPQIVMQQVRSVRQFSNERSFAILLGDHYNLVFKMHGRQANVVLFLGQRPQSLFRNNLPSDLEHGMESLDRQIDWGYEHFASHQSDLEATYFTFGKPVWTYLDNIGFRETSLAIRWELLIVFLWPILLWARLRDIRYVCTAILSTTMSHTVTYGNNEIHYLILSLDVREMLERAF